MLPGRCPPASHRGTARRGRVRGTAGLDERLEGEGFPGAGLRRAQVAMEAQRLGAQTVPTLDRDDHADHRLALLPFKLVLPRVEVPDDLEHEGTGERIAVVSHRAGRRQVPAPPRPDRPVRRDGGMLGDVAPPLLLRVVAPHAQDRGVPRVVALARAPRVVHVNGRDAALDRVARDELLELGQRERDEPGRGHTRGALPAAGGRLASYGGSPPRRGRAACTHCATPQLLSLPAV